MYEMMGGEASDEPAIGKEMKFRKKKIEEEKARGGKEDGR